MVSAWNLISRLTGFVRVLAVGAALGATFLGNTYQSANLVSNILFELLAAGMLSSVLVPSFVRYLANDDRDGAGALAASVLGALLLVLAPVVLLGMVQGEGVMRLLTIAVDDPSVRDHEIALGSFFLWFFLPQILIYAVGSVSTGILHADRRFNAPAAAPVLNNLIVISTMAIFWTIRDDGLSLELPLAQRLLLAMGTTLGVLAMSSLPLVAAIRAGFSLRPQLRRRNPELRAMARKGAWAAGYLGATQALLGVTLVLANRVEGGAVAYQIAFTFFLLPYALVGNPIMTTLFPRLSHDAQVGDNEAFGDHLGEGMRQLVVLIVPASVLLAVLAQPLVDLVSYGALESNATLVAHTLAAYAAGLVGYSMFQLLTRAMYAGDNTRTPTLINLSMTLVGSILMVWWSNGSHGAARVSSLGLAHSLVQLAGALCAYVVISSRSPQPLAIIVPMARSVLAALCAGGTAWLLAGLFNTEQRLVAGLSLGVAGLAGVAVYAGVQLALGSPELRRFSRQEADV